MTTMSSAATTGSGQAPVVLCPNCRQALPAVPGPIVCALCGLKGELQTFQPLPITVDHSEVALPEDARCMHHPTKRATAVCAGTGDFICALCAIDLNGETYSAQYLSTAGKEKVGRAFDRYLDRPDSVIVTCTALSLVPGPCYVMGPGVVLWLPYCIYKYTKAVKLRQTNPIYARVVGPVRMAIILIAMVVVALGLVIVMAAAVLGVASEMMR